MSTFKYKPWTDQTHKNYNKLVDNKLFKLWNHWLNPLGNWHEPLPFPQKRLDEANASKLPNFIWWTIRNPFHNIFSFWLGITPLGKRYEWIAPEERGWKNKKVYNWLTIRYREHSIPRFYITGELFNREIAIGWKSYGDLGFNFRYKRN